ncbi:hypothetical protein K3725_15475 [Leisingera sp. S132]|uniref:hypothetical protein n=1 Tax=Leisingera sp. S132 TaxID=2867016 RepID=UPI0021A6E6D7|nr:hypothetical protein [Leisingera sp. S132]UWQ78694.1 hypothetical protein K3725_15475 [Leisingera sp. S132]
MILLLNAMVLVSRRRLSAPLRKWTGNVSCFLTELSDPKKLIAEELTLIGLEAGNLKPKEMRFSGHITSAAAILANKFQDKSLLSFGSETFSQLESLRHMGAIQLG